MNGPMELMYFAALRKCLKTILSLTDLIVWLMDEHDLG
jgi:hypothetical protein